MNIKTYETREEWLADRRGRITGSRLKDILPKRGGGKKTGYYELIAEKLGLPSDEENPMERGQRLEEEALQMFEQEKGVKLDKSLVIWSREDNPGIAISPDGFIRKGKKILEAVEVKCLASAKHIEALLTGKVPSEYEEQGLQYFIVNDDLQKLSFAFFDPRLLYKPYFVIEIKREDVQAQIDECLAIEREVLAEITNIVANLSF